MRIPTGHRVSPCARVVAGRYCKGQQISTTLTIVQHHTYQVPGNLAQLSVVQTKKGYAAGSNPVCAIKSLFATPHQPGKSFRKGQFESPDRFSRSNFIYQSCLHLAYTR